ncbi:Sporulation related domain protein [compost metagenome]
MGQAARPTSQAPRTPDCPTFDQCAVQIGAFTSIAIAERELEIVASRFPDLTRPFSTFMRPVTARDGRTVYRTMFVDGSRIEAHALCNALKAAGRDCVVR